MRLYYDILENIEDFLNNNNNINTVYNGNIFDVDLNKQSIFPLSAIEVGEVVFSRHTATFQIRVLCLDIVDETKELHTDQNKPFYGVNNLQDIHNTQLEVVNALQLALRRGVLYDNDLEIGDDAIITARPFRDRIHSLLAGWGMDIDITIPNIDNTDGC